MREGEGQQDGEEEGEEEGEGTVSSEIHDQVVSVANSYELPITVLPAEGGVAQGEVHARVRPP